MHSATAKRARARVAKGSRWYISFVSAAKNDSAVVLSSALRPAEAGPNEIVLAESVKLRRGALTGLPFVSRQLASTAVSW
jgi:hypothetical protein